MSLMRELISDFYRLEKYDMLAKVDIFYAFTVLLARDQLSAQEVRVFLLYSIGYEAGEVAYIIGVTNVHVHRILRKICKQFVAVLGDEYRDSSMIPKIKRLLKRPLTQDELKFCYWAMRYPETAHRYGLTIFTFAIDQKTGKYVRRDGGAQAPAMPEE